MIMSHSIALIEHGRVGSAWEGGEGDDDLAWLAASPTLTGMYIEWLARLIMQTSLNGRSK